MIKKIVIGLMTGLGLALIEYFAFAKHDVMTATGGMWVGIGIYTIGIIQIYKSRD